MLLENLYFLFQVFQRMNLEEPLNSPKYDIADQHVKKLHNGYELDVKRFQTEGFFNPICVFDKDGLGMKIPDKSFGIGEVRSAVGSRRLLDVMNVNSKFVRFFGHKTGMPVSGSFH